jgi:hypothetical protein
VGEATVTGMLMVSGQLVGIGLIFLFNWLIDNHYYHVSGWVATGLTGYSHSPGPCLHSSTHAGMSGVLTPRVRVRVDRFSCAVMLLFTGRLKRREHEAAEIARGGDAINA